MESYSHKVVVMKLRVNSAKVGEFLIFYGGQSDKCMVKA